MNEEQYRSYQRKIQEGLPVTDAEHYQAQMYITGNPGMQSESMPIFPFDRQRQMQTDYDALGTMGVPNRMPTVPADFVANELREQRLGEAAGTPLSEGDKAILRGMQQDTQQRRNPWDLDPNALPFIYPGGSDINTQLFTAGRGLGMERGTQGRGLMIAGGLGAASMGISRNLLAGVGYENRQNYVRDWYRQQQNQPQYTNVSQTRNTNTLGGLPTNKYGGIFEEGGFMPGEEQAMMTQQEQQAPMQGQDQMQQVFQAVAGALQQGAQPEQVVEMLMQEGIPQEEAVAVVQEVMMMMQGEQQQMPQGDQMTQQMTQQEMAAQQQEQPMMKMGGKKVGDPVTFKYGGKKISGKIKKIENGKIFI
jgi:hypothetical protein